MGRLDGILNKSLGAIAAVVLIVGAGGGFKEMLIATKISELIGQWATQAHISPLLLGWGAAAVVRIATGSATVATITGAGIMAPIVQANPAVSKELMVLADRIRIDHLISRQRRRLLAGKGVLPVEPPRHLQILDLDGNPFVGPGPDLRASA